MKKIISALQPFAMTQEIIVYENGNKIDVISTTIENFSETILNTTNKYNITQLEFLGPVKYAQGIGKKIKEAEILKYNVNKLEIKYL